MSVADLPVFWDIADGLEGRIGTETPDEVLDVTAANGATAIDDIQVEELPDSPEIERAEQCTTTKQFKMPFEQAKQQLALYGRGTVLTDSSGNVTRILSIRIQRQKPNMAVVTVVTEALSFDTPPDEFDLNPIDLGLDILKHPRYRFALDPTIDDESNFATVGDTQVSLSSIKQVIIRAIQTYKDSPFFPSSDNLNGLIQNNVVGQLDGVGKANATINVQVPIAGFDPASAETSPPAWDGVIANLPAGNYRYAVVAVPVSDPGVQLAMAAAQEIIGKIWRMEDTPLLTAWEISWSSYYFALQPLNPGSYLENPLTDANPALPDYFWSTSVPLGSSPPRGGLPNPTPGADDAQTIFDQIVHLNPQCYSDDGTPDGVVNISWLRKADYIEYGRTWFKVTRRWVGSPIGTFDVDIYSGGNRPSSPSDYRTFDNPGS